MKILILGAGVQGTLYGVRLARAGHEVMLIARGKRAEELRARGAVIEHAPSARVDTVRLTVMEQLSPGSCADVCLVTVRREQMDEAVAELRLSPLIARVVFMVNHANGSQEIFEALGRSRAVMAFPGAGGSLEAGVVRYVETREQPTAVEADAKDVIALFQGAGFQVGCVRDMDAWLRRHAVFVTAVCGALYLASGSAARLVADWKGVERLILAVREGWSALDELGVRPAPFALRTIFCWVPLRFAIGYWQRFLGSSRGELYFAAHARHAPAEMAALATDIRRLLNDAPMPCLGSLYAAIDEAVLDSQRGLR